MEALMKVVVVVVSLALALSYAHAETGTATYYTPPYVPSACYGFEDQGTMIAAASDGLYNNGEACGRMYTVTCTGPTNLGVQQPCTGNSVTVKVVDRCPSPGCQGTIDLSQEAFSMIANPDAGKVNIDFTQ
ncbi:EG45-like domain containing protein [Cucumis sativus]|uniref:Expansin-like EG45 domain-containing protein n=1 Tax=Cucumis sativus TaxID=3659 RepID=A0A0A0KX23_CUCSA|nr:EG45-like domain containing protein [Cucumis sativus]